MQISKIILDQLKDNNVADLFFQQFQAYTFDSERSCIQTLNDINMLHQLGIHEYLLMPGMDSQLLQLPFSYEVPVVDFKPIESLDVRNKLFGQLNFVAEFSQGALSLFYHGKKVYEEPVFFKLEDSDEKASVNHPLFDDRLDQLREALKIVYGKKSRLESTLAYPTIGVTKDPWVYYSEQIAPFLEAGDYDLLNSLQVMLAMALTSEEYASFLKLVSCDNINIDVVVDTLLKEYARFSSVSIGYRTAVWDCMVAVYAYFKPEFEHEEIAELLSGHLQDDSDIGMIAPFESLGYQVQLFLKADEGCKQAMALGLMCFAITCK